MPLSSSFVVLVCRRVEQAEDVVYVALVELVYKLQGLLDVAVDLCLYLFYLLFVVEVLVDGRQPELEQGMMVWRERTIVAQQGGMEQEHFEPELSVL